MYKKVFINKKITHFGFESFEGHFGYSFRPQLLSSMNRLLWTYRELKSLWLERTRGQRNPAEGSKNIYLTQNRRTWRRAISFTGSYHWNLEALALHIVFMPYLHTWGSVRVDLMTFADIHETNMNTILILPPLRASSNQC